MKKKTLKILIQIVCMMVVGLWGGQLSAQQVTYLWSTGDTSAQFQANPRQTTTYYVTVTQYGVSYVDSITLLVNHTFLTQVSATICDNESYSFNGNSYTQAGVYFDTLQSSLSCDSVIETTLQVNPTYLTQVSATICDSESYSFNGNNYTQAGVYYDTLQSVSSCDSVIETTLQVNPTYLTQVSATICDNESYNFNGNNYTQAGVYFDTLQSVSSCDSVIETTLQVNPTYLTQVSATICDNEVYAFNGNSYYQAGVYYDTLQSVSSCDSVIETSLTVNPTYLTQGSATICDNESYSFNGNSYSQAGVYYDTLQSVTSCDSVIETTLQVYPTYLTQVSATICDNESYSFNGNSYTQAGVYFDTLQSVSSCDSVIETTLQVNPTYLTQVSATICDNESFSFNGNSYSQAGVYFDTLQSVSSCDSVIETSLTVNPTYLTQVSATICDNESYSFNGNNYTQTGVYFDTLQSVSSCDSVIETTLQVNPTYLTQVSATICDSESYSFNGNNYTQAGVYYDTLQSVSSCDSVIETTLQVNPTYLTQVSATICDNESYNFNGNTYTQTGVYFDTLQSVSSCDSVIETTLQVNPTYLTQVSATICDNESYNFNGNSYTQTGVYFDTLQSVSSCDSVIETSLTVNPTYFTQVSASICDNESYSFNGKTYTQAGVYYDTLHSTSSCDSVIETTLQVNPTYLTQVSATICDNESYNFNGNNYSQAGVYFDTLQSVSSCDSVIETTLQVNPSHFVQTSASGCNGSSFLSPSGKTYTAAGVYYDTIPNSYGCDSVIETSLSFYPTHLVQIMDTICSNQAYFSPSGNLLSSTGVYLDTFSTKFGCDSIIEINLQVKNAFVDSSVFNACDGAEYQFPSGKIVKGNGWHFDSLKTTQNCDSIYVVNISYWNKYQFILRDTLCFGDTITLVNGQKVHQQGVYQIPLQTVNGCDSLFIYQVIQLPSYNRVEDVSICDGQGHNLPNGQWVYSSGQYFNNYTSKAGCDSSFVTNVSMFQNYNDTVYATICERDYYQLPDGQWATEAGTYLSALVSKNECDSLITTIISVNKLENFKSIRGATKVKQYNNYQYLTDSFPNYSYLWKVKGGIFVGDSTHAKTWVQWTDSLSGTIMVNVNDFDSACFYSNLKVVSVAKPVPSGLGSVSIEELDLQIIPNPNYGNFSIALKGLSNQTIQLQILDQTGKLVFTQQNIEFKGQLLNINENLSSGAYYIRLITNEAPMVKRFVVR